MAARFSAGRAWVLRFFTSWNVGLLKNRRQIDAQSLGLRQEIAIDGQIRWPNRSQAHRLST